MHFLSCSMLVNCRCICAGAEAKLNLVLERVCGLVEGEKPRKGYAVSTGMWLKGVWKRN